MGDYPGTFGGVLSGFQSASFRRPALVGEIPGTPAVYRVTRNRRPPDACLMDGIAGMSWFSWLPIDALSIQSVDC